jgi:hypothetical protein
MMLCPNSWSSAPTLIIIKQQIGNDKNCPFCSLSHSWFHPLENKAHCSLSPTTFLYPPLDLALEAGLIPWCSKPNVPYVPPPLFAGPLPLLSPKCYLRLDPLREAAGPFFSRPATLLIKLMDMRNLSWASFVCDVWHFPNKTHLAFLHKRNGILIRGTLMVDSY